MTSKEFEVEIQKLDPRFSVQENPNRAGLSNIYFEGKNYDLPVLSTNDIRNEIDQTYRYEFPNGMTARYWSHDEILARVMDFLERFKLGKIDQALYAKD